MPMWICEPQSKALLVTIQTENKQKKMTTDKSEMIHDKEKKKKTLVLNNVLREIQ